MFMANCPAPEETATLFHFHQLTHSSFRHIAQILTVAVAYTVAGRLGLLLAIPPGYATAIFPPSGIALGCALLWGRPALLGVWLGSATMNLNLAWTGASAPDNTHIVVALVIACGSTLQAYTGQFLLKRLLPVNLYLDSDSSLLRFLLAGACLSTFVSATIGVSCLHLSGTIALQEVIYSWLTWWVGDALGVLLFTPAVLIALAQPRAYWQPLWRTVALPLVVTFAIAVWLFVRASAWENERIRSEFMARSAVIGERIHNLFDNGANYLHSTERLFASSHHVDIDEFQQFTAFALSHAGELQAIEWIPEIPADERADFEKAAVTEFSGFRLWQQDANGKTTPAEQRANYYPIYYVEPLVGNLPMQGFDLGSEQRRRAVVEKALNSTDVVLSERINLLQDQQYGVLMLLRVRNPTASPLQQRGLVCAVIRLKDTLDSSIKDWIAPGLTLTLLDLDSPGDRNLLYQNGEAGEQSTSLQTETEWNVGGRHWRFRLQANGSYLAQHRSWQSWFVLVGGLLFSGLLGAMLLLISGRTARIQQLVEERTAALKRSKTQLRAIMDGAMDAIILADREGHILTWNSAAEKMFAVSHDDMREARLTEFIADWTEAVYRNVMLTRQRRVEINVQRRNGLQLPVELGVAVIHLDDKPCFIALLHDVSSRYEVDRLKNEFVSMVSHELRTPLTSIRGSLGLLSGGVLGTVSPEIQRLISVANQNSERLTLLINDLLDIEKLELGHIELKLETVDLLPLLVRTLEENEGYASTHAVTVKFSPGLLMHQTVKIAPDRFVQVMNNLLSNAIKFSPAHSVVEVTTSMQGNFLRISVWDKGLGIPEAQQKHIFTKFWQADATAKRAHSGTGLGLAIARILVEKMHGHIGFISQVSEGTCFYIDLPLIR